MEGAKAARAAHRRRYARGELVDPGGPLGGVGGAGGAGGATSGMSQTLSTSPGINREVAPPAPPTPPSRLGCGLQALKTFEENGARRGRPGGGPSVAERGGPMCKT